MITFFAILSSSIITSVCTPLRRLLLIKLLLLTTTLMGQLQTIVKSDRSLSHTVTKRTSIFDNMTQGRGHHCCVCTGPTQKSNKKKGCVNKQKVRQITSLPTMFTMMVHVKVQESDPQMGRPQKTSVLSQRNNKDQLFLNKRLK